MELKLPSSAFSLYLSKFELNLYGIEIDKVLCFRCKYSWFELNLYGIEIYVLVGMHRHFL